MRTHTHTHTLKKKGTHTHTLTFGMWDVGLATNTAAHPYGGFSLARIPFIKCRILSGSLHRVLVQQKMLGDLSNVTVPQKGLQAAYHNKRCKRCPVAPPGVLKIIPALQEPRVPEEMPAMPS